MKTVTYSVPAIHCDHCIHTVEMEVGELSGVQGVKADLASRKVVVHFDDPASEAVIKQTLAEINYPVVA
jgi:copper ion binding protein